MNSTCFWSRNVSKKIILSLRNHQLTENSFSFLLLVSKKGQKRNKSKFVTTFVGIILYYYFDVKISPKLVVKFLLTLVLFHWSHESQNCKQTSRTPSAIPHQLIAHINWRASQLIIWFYFRVSEYLLIYLTKHCWSLLNSPNLIP